MDLAHLGSLPGYARGLVQPDAKDDKAPATGSKGSIEVEEPNRAQRSTARRMAESKATIPHLYLQAEIDMTESVAMRGLFLKDLKPGEVAPTVHDFIIRACALALRGFPRVNASYRDGKVERYEQVNVGFAVAASETYVVPTLFAADTKKIGEIATEKRELTERARREELTAPEMGGGTFTVSNLGMYGVSNFAPVIIPPQAGILGVGEVATRPSIVEGKIVPRQLMRVTLGCDHRVLHGADGAEFLGRVKSLLEEPDSLIP